MADFLNKETNYTLNSNSIVSTVIISNSSYTTATDIESVELNDLGNSQANSLSSNKTYSEEEFEEKYGTKNLSPDTYAIREEKILEQYDINGDGKLSEEDLKLIRKEIENKTNNLRYDANDDGILDINDAELFEKYLNNSDTTIAYGYDTSDGIERRCPESSYSTVMYSLREQRILEKYGAINKDTINELRENIKKGTAETRFDANADGVVNEKDANILEAYMEDPSVDVAYDCNGMDEPCSIYAKKYTEDLYSYADDNGRFQEIYYKVFKETNDFNYVKEYMDTYFDANGNGKFDIKDVTTIQKLVKDKKISEKDSLKYDINGDGKLNYEDYNLMLKYKNGTDISDSINSIYLQKIQCTKMLEQNNEIIKQLELLVAENNKHLEELDEEAKTEPVGEELINGSNEKGLYYSTLNKQYNAYIDFYKKRNEEINKQLGDLDHQIEYDNYSQYTNTSDYKKFIENYKYNYQGLDYSKAYDYLQQSATLQDAWAAATGEEVDIDPIAYAEYIMNERCSDNKDMANYDAYFKKYTELLKKSSSGEKLTTEEKKQLTEYQNKLYDLYTGSGAKPGLKQIANTLKSTEDLDRAIKCVAFMTYDERNIYHYLYAKKGAKEANKYLDFLQDEINQREGYCEAKEFFSNFDISTDVITNEDGTIMDEDNINELNGLISKGEYNKKYDFNNDNKLDSKDTELLSNYLLLGGKLDGNFKNWDISFKRGIGDGVDNFFQGLGNIFNNSTDYTVDDYKKMYIAQMFSQNTGYKNTYEFGSSVGNMLPVVVASTVVSIAATPAAGYTVLGISAQQIITQSVSGALIFGSTYGNTKHQNLCEGYDPTTARLHALAMGANEALLEVCLGSIVGPELKATSFKNITINILKEGFTESIQEVSGAMLDQAILGKEIDISELKGRAAKSFLFGCLMAGLFDSGDAINLLRIKIGDKIHTMTKSDVLAYLDAEEGAKKYGNEIELYEFLDPKYKEEVIIKSENVDQEVASIMIKYNTSKEIASLMVDNNISFETANSRIDAIKSITSPDDALSKFKNDNITSQQMLDYIKYTDIDPNSVEKIFKEYIGKDLADWIPNTETANVLFENLLSACNDANIKQSDLTKSMKLLDAMKSYYADAKNIQEYLQSGKGTFETYRTHGIVHIMDVFTKSIEATAAFKNAGVEGMNVDSVMLAAIMHDTGMSGGKQLSLSVDANGKLNIKTIDVQMDGDNIRESHSFNSGVNVIENFETLRKMGYTDAQISEAALLAFAHSKSNSGLNPLLNNPAGWSFAIQALQEATAGSGFDFVGSLKDAGIIKDTQTKGSATVTVKSPKKYKTNAEGKLIDANGKVVGTEGAGEPVLADDYKPNNKKTFKGEVGVYEFTDGILDKLSYEALAVRIGDALTNNDNGKINQFGGEIIINDEITNFNNQYSLEEVLASLQKNENYKTKLEYTTSDTIVQDLMKNGALLKAAEVESKHDTPETSVLFGVEKDGKIIEYNKSQPFVLGENNQTYSVKGDENGVEVDITIKDSNHVPFSTIFAIEERAGELKSFIDDGVAGSNDNYKPLTLVIDLGVNPDPNISKLYYQYEEYYSKDNRINVVVKPPKK